MLDEKYQTIERSVLTVGDLFGKVGGMDSILWIFALLFIKIVIKKIYLTSLISSFYNVQEEIDLSVVNKLNVKNEEIKCSAFDINRNVTIFEKDSEIF